MEQRSIGRLIAILHRNSQVFINKKIKDLGITSAEYPFLFALYKEEGRTQGELSSYLFIDKAATARVIKTLIHKGLVRREQDCKDKRCNRIFLTDAAKALEQELRSRVTLWSELITKTFNDEEYRAAFAALEQMVESIETSLDTTTLERT